ncbi:hypothetical protein ACIPRI_01805 [Variovorax sp. LARHSF232]
MTNAVPPAQPRRERVLNPVDRISEALFGLLMALSFVGALSVAESGQAEIRAMFIAALGCNLAWGLVDAVMYLVRTITDRGRALALAMPEPRPRPKLNSQDLLAALAVFLVVVAATFPVVLPFVLLDDVGTAKNVSRAIALALLFIGGLGLGRYAGYGSWKAGLLMAGLGSVLVVAINLLGG